MPPKAKAPPPKAGKKAPPAALARMREAVARQEAAEEEARRKQEEYERQLLEEARLAEAERKREEAERAEAEELRRAEAKRARKERAANRGPGTAALERMRAAGLVLPDVEKLIEQDTAEKAAAAQRPKPEPRRPKAPSAPLVPEPSLAKPAEDELADDWEAEIEREETRAAEAAAAEALRLAEAAKPAEKRLRAPICCVLGHVDAGKTSLLDRLRHSNVQGGEAGGITQQIGATFFPYDAIVEATAQLNERRGYDLEVPGLLIIDTPGHESFSNLRSRGSSLCDIAVVVVDIMEGLQPQTKESLRMLRDRKCPFLVALNKVDRLYDWKPMPNADIETTLASQKSHVRDEYQTRVSDVLLQLQMEGFNAELYYRNEDMRRYVSVVPTSSMTGEGMCDLVLLMVRLVQTYLERKVTFREGVECTVLEVRPVDGLGMTIDVILVNGTLHIGDTVVLCGSSGPIRTVIRALLTPKPLHEMRVKGQYIRHDKVEAAIGVKLLAEGLEDVVAGTPLAVLSPTDNFDEVAMRVTSEARNLCTRNLVQEGVAVQSSTLGSLEALLSFLSDMKVPVASINIGKVHKRHIIPIVHMQNRNPRHAILLAFDVAMSDEARQLVEKHHVRVVERNIIYHLFDAFREYVKGVDKAETDALRRDAVFPVELKVSECYHDSNPIILGVTVGRGVLHPDTPVGFVHKTHKTVVTVGRVVSMERDHRPVERVKPGETCSVKIVNSTTPQYGYANFRDVTSTLVSVLSRKSIDAVKHFKGELSQDAVNLLRDLRDMQNIKEKARPAASTTSTTPEVSEEWGE